MSTDRAHVTWWAALCLIGALAAASAIRLSARGAAAAQTVAADTAQPSPPPRSLAAQGKLIFDHTPEFAGKYVGDKLSCSDCHIASGTADYASSMKDVAGLFPSFSKRAGRVITLTDRINECMVRSENGRPLPPESPQMLALTAYLQFLAKGQAHGQPYARRGLVKLPVLKGDAARGKLLYARTCAVCHGTNGAGMPPVMPPLWGPDSYNDGAGMSHPAKMAAWVFHNMPQNNPGSLTPQQAYDLSAYIDGMPRPKFHAVYSSF